MHNMKKTFTELQREELINRPYFLQFCRHVDMSGRLKFNMLFCYTWKTTFRSARITSGCLQKICLLFEDILFLSSTSVSVSIVFKQAIVQVCKVWS